MAMMQQVLANADDSLVDDSPTLASADKPSTHC
jgi:hypothetical protein